MYVPDEIWAQIFDFIGPLGPLPTGENWWLDKYSEKSFRASAVNLAALCKVSRRFRRIAQPILFRSLSDYGPGERRRLTRIVSALIDNPLLGRHVRAVGLRFTWEADYNQLHDALVNSCTMFGDDGVQPAVKYVLEHIQWLYEQHGGYVSCPALILAFSPNLTTFNCTIRLPPESLLSVELELLSGSLDLKAFARLVRGGWKLGEELLIPAQIHFGKDEDRSLTFKQLREVRLNLKRGSTSNSTVSVRLVEPVLLLPSLQVLGLNRVEWSSFELSKGMRWQHTTSNIHILNLKLCVIDTPGLKNIFTRCPNLLELTIELGVRRSNRPSDHGKVSLQEFGEVFRGCGSKLETLAFHKDRHSHFNFADEKLGSLRELSNLKKLLVIAEDWVGITREAGPARTMKDNLPTSLEWLRLYYNENTFDSYIEQGDWKCIESQLYSVITSGRFPNLRKITVEGHTGVEGDFEYRSTVEGWDSETTTRRISTSLLPKLLTLTNVS